MTKAVIDFSNITCMLRQYALASPFSGCSNFLTLSAMKLYKRIPNATIFQSISNDKLFRYTIFQWNWDDKFELLTTSNGIHIFDHSLGILHASAQRQRRRKWEMVQKYTQKRYVFFFHSPLLSIGMCALKAINFLMQENWRSQYTITKCYEFRSVYHALSHLLTHSFTHSIIDRTDFAHIHTHDSNGDAF